ncbi:guanine deaminase [Kaistia dalseonensis]|uniref:Guanine deaminase n=1 Tax=Kaistia dalseonensis TaxID=410840 RepID=A0ABU0HDW7_9HYPH|nr:guanine deaminase [Kaistia dalseonensis]MCX5497399.1 guanine deaminase [Kaistia dalseonensis]MDQ0440038.1 guanine deaminase [Kaistia dalseonensis]
MTDLRGKTIAGTFFHAPHPGSIEILADALITLDARGDIADVSRWPDAGHAEKRKAAEDAGTLVTMPAGTYVLPGFVDLHIHAPQYPQLGKALNVPLEVWLHRYTFPLEARYADIAFARHHYDMLVGDLIANGTTTALYFATVHQEATRLLVDICIEKGQRALVGKVAMDDPEQCPDYYRDASSEAGIADTRALIDYVAAHPENHGLVHPVITPRFVPSCTDPLLEGLGALAQECGCHVQTHCSESDWAHGYVLSRFGKTDTETLDGFGLLTRRTVLAHSNFLTEDDMDRVAARGAGVAHCPLSNAYFANSVFPLRAALAKGVRVGLGTDISGGPSASMIEAQRMAIAASRMLETGVDPDIAQEKRGRPGSRIDFDLAFHLATAAGGDALDLPVGQFKPGYHFDAILVDPSAPGSTLRVSEELDTDEDVLQKIVYTASRANLTQVWIAGRSVSGGTA